MDSKKRRFSVQQNPCCTVCESTKAWGKTPIQMYDHKNYEGHVSLKAEGYQGYEEDLESRNETHPLGACRKEGYDDKSLSPPPKPEAPRPWAGSSSASDSPSSATALER